MDRPVTVTEAMCRALYETRCPPDETPAGGLTRWATWEEVRELEAPRITAQIEAALRAAPALPAAEAVAWRSRHHSSPDGWLLLKERPRLNDPFVVTEPLYTHPAPDASTEKSDPDDVTAPSSGVPARKGGSARMKTLHPDASALRERFARIIDPQTFDLIEHYNAIDNKPKGEAPEVSTFRAYPSLREDRDRAFAKADAILAALSQGEA